MKATGDPLTTVGINFTNQEDGLPLAFHSAPVWELKSFQQTFPWCDFADCDHFSPALPNYAARQNVTYLSYNFRSKSPELMSAMRAARLGVATDALRATPSMAHAPSTAVHVYLDAKVWFRRHAIPPC
jgi:hypothetical protein